MTWLIVHCYAFPVNLRQTNKIIVLFNQMNSRYTRKQRDTPPRSKSFLYATISIELVGIEEKCTPNHWVGIGRGSSISPIILYYRPRSILI